MNNCRSCGISIPEGQTVCSMCYGDPYYGKDDYYLRELEKETQREEERRREEDFDNEQDA